MGGGLRSGFFLTTDERPVGRRPGGRQWGVSSDAIPGTHAAAMTAVLRSPSTAALLLRAGWWGAAGLTVLGAALGPMALLSPWSASADDLGSPAAPSGARIVVGLVAAVWMSATAWYARAAAGCRERRTRSPPTASRSRRS